VALGDGVWIGRSAVRRFDCGAGREDGGDARLKKGGLLDGGRGGTSTSV